LTTPRRILHVDDDPAVTALVAEYLKEYGYTSTQFNNPCEVISQLQKFQERVVLLDIDMPQLNGLQLLKQIKTLDGGIQVIMLTGFGTMNSVLQSLRWGAEACFFKPLTDFEPLFAALSDCFQKIDRWWITLNDLTQYRNDEDYKHNVESMWGAQIHS
jgi:DNA-binding NtrC family response regulator